jgi:hypothetical protein
MSEPTDQPGASEAAKNARISPSTWVAGVCCLLMVVGLGWMIARDRAREERVAALMTQRNTIDPEAVARAVRTMKLVTVQINTAVRIEKTVDSFFFGEGKAKVQVPVVASYATDLSKMHASGIQVSRSADRAIVKVRIPRPARLAVEIFAEAETTDVERSWRRFVWWSGESQLDEARLQVPEEARALELLTVHRLKVENDTREQVARLIRMIVAGDPDDAERLEVEVLFEDEREPMP